MTACKTCGVDHRFRKIAARAIALKAEEYQAKAEKLERKYKLNLEQAREANKRLRSNLDSQRYTIKLLRDKIC